MWDHAVLLIFKQDEGMWWQLGGGNSQHNSTYNSETKQETSSFSKTLPVSQVWTGLVVVRPLSFMRSGGHKSQFSGTKELCKKTLVQMQLFL